jgi:hypothetical protein
MLQTMQQTLVNK